MWSKPFFHVCVVLSNNVLQHAESRFSKQSFTNHVITKLLYDIAPPSQPTKNPSTYCHSVLKIIFALLFS